MTPVLYLALLVSLSGLVLSLAARRCGTGGGHASDMLDAVLPQTQCGRCGYRGCRPYADAMARRETDVNRCPPGGDFGIRVLADLLGRPGRPLDAKIAATPPTIVVIDEERCIGCTLCIQACPVDAIVGASKLMHTVIASECTGCNRCLPPCPVDCIAIVNKPGEWQPLFVRRQVAAQAHLPCIRCGSCNSACPESLEPSLLHNLIANGQIQLAGGNGLVHCTECGDCNDVCPSRIPLTAWLRIGKHDLARATADGAATERTRRRYVDREARLLRLAKERDEAMRRRKQLLLDKAARQERIRASIARAAARTRPGSGAIHPDG